MMPAIYGSSYDDRAGAEHRWRSRYEMIHETRVIPLDSRPHVGTGSSSYMGDARGRWEGNTLVVETHQLQGPVAYRNANGATLRSSSASRPSVRARRVVASPSTIPTWTRPWTFAMNLTKKDGTQPPFEYACHEGNYGLRNILSAARAEERAAPEGR